MVTMKERSDLVILADRHLRQESFVEGFAEWTVSRFLYE